MENPRVIGRSQNEGVLSISCAITQAIGTKCYVIHTRISLHVDPVSKIPHYADENILELGEILNLKNLWS